MTTTERTWFVATPEDITSSRAVLHLGLNKALRYYRERVVPGIAGVWFVRQLCWAVAGLRLAPEHNKPPALLATAIEALACKMEWYCKDEDELSRVRGTRAFSRHEGALTFSELSQPKYYVSQPFRMSTTRALVGLDLAEGTRFNAMRLTDAGNSLANVFLDQRRGTRSLRSILSSWIKKNDCAPDCSDGEDSALQEFLSPDKPTQGEKECVHERLVELDPWRRAIIEAFRTEEEVPKTDDLLKRLNDEQRLAIETARAFDNLLETARGVIRSCAQHIANGYVAGVSEITDAVRSEIQDVKQTANKFSEAANRTPRDQHADACRVAEEIRVTQPLNELLASIVRRDGQVLRWQDTGPVQGPLFEAWQRGPSRSDAGDGEQSVESSCENKLRQLFELWRDCR